jgi:hypothetical protein
MNAIPASILIGRGPNANRFWRRLFFIIC